MLITEFIERTGFTPTNDEYQKIEQQYYDFEGSKEEFCKAFVANEEEKKIYQYRADYIADLESQLMDNSKLYNQKIDEMQKKIDDLTAKLDNELEWKLCEMAQNVSQEDYKKLSADAESGKGSHYMTDEEAKDWICSEFDFDRSKIVIVHEIDEFQINRHGYLRKTGNKIDRRPVYCATDYHYIRFNTTRFYYECWNGELRPYYC